MRRLSIQDFFTNVRENMIKIELIEMFAISLIGVIWTADVGWFIIVYSVWGLYLGYIRLSRAGGWFADLGVWWIVHALTAGVSAVLALLLDANRFILKLIFYRGEAPIEYAWSYGSKVRRKQWEEERKAES